MIPNANERLSLATLQPFAQGGKRNCYVHPVHPGCCVKVLRTDRNPAMLWQQTPWWRRWRKSARDFDENHHDWQIFQALGSLHNPDVWEHLPQCHGWVETDLGPGLAVELIRDADGLISRSFQDHLWMHGRDASIQAAVDEFARFWETGLVPSRGIGLYNIAAQVQDNGRLRLVLVDGLGNTEYIPLSQWCRPYARFRARRKIQVLRQDVELVLGRRERGESSGPHGFLVARR